MPALSIKDFSNEYLSLVAYGHFDRAKALLSSHGSSFNDSGLRYLEMAVGLFEHMPHSNEMAAFSRLFNFPIFLSLEAFLEISECAEFLDFNFSGGTSPRVISWAHAEMSLMKKSVGFEYVLRPAFDSRKFRRGKDPDKRQKKIVGILRKAISRKIESVPIKKLGQGEPRKRIKLKRGRRSRSEFHIAFGRIEYAAQKISHIFQQKTNIRLQHEITKTIPGCPHLSSIEGQERLIADLINWRIRLDLFAPDGSPISFRGFNHHDIHMWISGRKHEEQTKD